MENLNLKLFYELHYFKGHVIPLNLIGVAKKVTISLGHFLSPEKYVSHAIFTILCITRQVRG